MLWPKKPADFLPALPEFGHNSLPLFSLPFFLFFWLMTHDGFFLFKMPRITSYCLSQLIWTSTCQKFSWPLYASSSGYVCDLWRRPLRGPWLVIERAEKTGLNVPEQTDLPFSTPFALACITDEISWKPDLKFEFFPPFLRSWQQNNRYGCQIKEL